MPSGPATVLGGLPVIADISFGKDADTWISDGEYWSEVDTIYWMKRDGSKGKEIPQHLRDRAEKYDCGFCDLIESVTDHLIHNQWEREQIGALVLILAFVWNSHECHPATP